MFSTTPYLYQNLLHSEAEIEAVGAKPLISSTFHSRSQLKQYDTEVVTREAVRDILTDLGLRPESELTRTVVNGDNKQSILASLFVALSSAGKFKRWWSVPISLHNSHFTLLRCRGPAKDRPERAGAGELEGSPLVLEKDYSENCCGDQEERSSDIMSHVINCLFLVYNVMMQMLR